MLRNVMRAVLAVSVVLGLIGVGAAANAVPAPANGPVTGGTEVTIDAPPGVTFTQVSAGTSHSVAVASDGTVYAWGYNGSGQLGNGTFTDRNVPVPVPTPVGVSFTQVSAGTLHSVALAADGAVYTWGSNYNGQLGNGTNTSSNVPVPVQMPAGVSFTQVSAATSYSVAVAADGTVYAWGYNGSGQLGDGTTTDRNVPVSVKMPAGVSFTQVSASTTYSVAVAADGTVYAWGYNGSGQLGDGTYTNRSAPVSVVMPAGVTFTQVSAGDAYSVAVAADGAAYAWGFNLYGQLGDGTNTSRNVPVSVVMPAGVTFTQVSADDAHSVALAEGGAAYTWGFNLYGQLGDGTDTNRNVPVSVVMPAGVTFTQVSAGYAHSVAVAADGTAYAWGYNSSGRLGDGTNANRSVPTQVLTQAAVTGVLFGGTSATNLVDNGDGSWTATTPPHTAGPVDVVVSWELNGVARPDVTYAGAFTYVVPGVAPTVTDPADQSVTAGDTATFTVDTTGTPEPGLSWEFSTDDGATWDAVTAADGTVSSDGKTLTVAATEALSGTLYRATATNSVGAATSAAALLTVSAAPVSPTVSDPADQSVTAGDTATFTVDTTGTPSPTLTWEISTDDGATWDAVTAGDGTVSADGKTLTVAATEALSGFHYRVTAENTVGAATSAAATLAVSAAPVSPTVSDPADQSVTAGDTATFTVDTTGTPSPTLTWEISTDDGATWDAVTAADGTVSADGKTLTVAATEALSGFHYRVTAENTVGAVTSAAATLTVTAAPVAPVSPTVTDPVGENDLARTGSDVAPSIAVAILIALVGAGFLLTSRRRRA